MSRDWLAWHGEYDVPGSRLEQRLIRQIDRTLCNLHLLVGSGKVEQRSTNFVLDSATQIIQLLAILPQCGFRLQNISMYAPALKYREIQCPGHVKRSVRSRRINSNIAVIGFQIDGRQIFRPGSVAPQFACSTANLFPGRERPNSR